MSKIKLSVLFLTVGLMLAISGTALAEDAPAQTEIEMDETVIAEDLGIKEPKLLPDSKFYFLKNWGRNIRSFFTFSKVKKAELQLRYASERLLEARKLAVNKKKAVIQNKAVEKYKEAVAKIKDAAYRIKDNASTSLSVGKFLDKFTKHEVLHLRILDKLEQQVPTSTTVRIRTARESHLQKFGEVMIKLETNKVKITERLEKNLEELKGSQFKQVKNLEILKRIEEKMPETAKQAVRRARENTLIKFKGKLEKMPVEEQKKVRNYVEKIRGAEEIKIEILENFKWKPIQLEKIEIQAEPVR